MPGKTAYSKGLRGWGALQPRAKRNAASLRSNLANLILISAIRTGLEGMAYNILLIQWCNAFSDPDAPAAHLVGKHHIRHQAIADDGYLAWMRHTSFWMLLEMGHDFLVASWLLDAMREDEHASFFLQLGGKTTVSVIAGSTGRVRYN